MALEDAGLTEIATAMPTHVAEMAALRMWVKSGPADAERGLPLYPRTRTGGGGRFSQCGDVLPVATPMVLHFRPGVPEKPLVIRSGGLKKGAREPDHRTGGACNRSLDG